MSLKKLIEYLKDTLDEDVIPVNRIEIREKKLLKVYEEASKCKNCPLWRGRENLVFGSGNPYSQILLVGEAPGEDEDKIGIPFVGRAGRKLTEVMLKYGIKRESVYITNTLKCRPPSNRNPKPEELKECFKYLKEQIKIISPEIILCLGRYASLVILGEKRGISHLRQKEFYQFGAKVFVTYHPSAILRNPNLTPLFEEDIEKISKFILK